MKIIWEMEMEMEMEKKLKMDFPSVKNIIVIRFNLVTYNLLT